MAGIRNLIFGAAAFLLSSLPAFAQTSPGWTFGFVPTPAQWNAQWASKQDYLGAAPCLVSGCTISGLLITAPSSALTAGLNIPHGVAPTSPNNGDVWTTTSGIFVRINGGTVGPLVGPGGGVLTAGSTATVGYASGQILGSNGSVLSVYSVSGSGNVALTTSPTLTTPVINGLPTGTGVAAPPTISTIVVRDGNASIFANNFIFNTTNVVSAGGTTTLTVASSRYQRITGTLTQIFQLPVATQLTNGWTYEFDNNSTGALTINNASAGLVTSVPPGGYLRITAVDTTTTNGIWDPHWFGPSNVSWGTTGLSFTGNSANALTVGPNGTTNPAFTVDASVGSLVAGIKITGAVTGGTVTIAAIESGINTNLAIDSKGAGQLSFNSIATGPILLGRATTISGALTYGGVTLTNAVTGTGNMVLSASPTLSGTVSGNLTLSGNITHSAQGVFTGTSSPSSAAGNTVVMGTISTPVLANNGQAFFYNQTVNGASIQGQGSTYDVSLTASGGSVALGVSTGTVNLVAAGKIGAASLSTVGTVGGSLCRTAGGDFLYVSGLNCFTSGAATSLAPGTTTISPTTSQTYLYDNAGVLGERTFAAVKSDQTTATSNIVAVTPGSQQFHPSAVKAYGFCLFSGGTSYTLNNAYNISGANCGRTGVGTFSMTFGTAFTSTTTYQCNGSIANGNPGTASATNTSTTVVGLSTFTAGGAAQDVSFMFACYGTQ